MEWLNNQWVIGIGTSLISGFLVFFFTRKFFKEKQKKEYKQKIRTANNEILYAIRPLIVEKTKPNVEILDSVFCSTVRKYGLELHDIYDKGTLCDDLINEIMSNSFLSSDQKMELVKMISELKCECINEVQEKVNTIYQDNKLSSSTYMAILLSTMTAITVLFFTFWDKSLGLPEPLSILLVLIIPVLALTMTTLIKNIREKEKIREAREFDSIQEDEKNVTQQRRTGNGGCSSK